MYTPWSVGVATETLPVVEPHEFFSETSAFNEVDPRSSLLESLEGDLFHNLFSSFSTSPPTSAAATATAFPSSSAAQFVFPSPYASASASSAVASSSSSVSSSASSPASSSSASAAKRKQRSVPGVAAATKGKLVKKKQHTHGNNKPHANVVKKPTPSEDEEEDEEDEEATSGEAKDSKDSKDSKSSEKRGKLGIACEFCRERHISCIMERTKEESGAAPSWSCSNCRTRGIKCVVVARRKRGPKPKSARGELTGEGGNHFNNLTSTFTYIPSSVPSTSSSSSSSTTTTTTTLSSAIPASYLGCLSIQGGSPGEGSPGVSTASPSSSTMTPSSSSSINSPSSSSSSSSNSPWPTSNSPSFATSSTSSSSSTASTTAIPPPALSTGFYRTATTVPSTSSGSAAGPGSGFSSSTIPAIPTSVASFCTTAPAPSEFPPAAPPSQPEVAVTSSSSPTLYDHASLILKIHPLPIPRSRGPDSHYPSYFPFDDYVAMYRAGNLQDCGMVHPDKIAALGHPSSMLVNNLEGRMKQLIVVSSLIMGAASLRHMEKAYSLYLQALQLADEPRPWRTRYIKSASIPNPMLSAGFIPDYYSPGSLEEELRQLKQDKQLCRALVQLTTATRYVEWSHPQRAPLAGACFECATVMLKRWNRVSRHYSIPVPESVKRVTLSALMLSYTCFDAADKIRCQELLLSVLCSNPSRISWPVAHPQRPAGLSNNPILAITPSPIASRKFPTEFRMWVLTSAILQDIFDIFCTIQHQSSSSARRSPPTCPPASFNSKTTTSSSSSSSSGFAPRYAAPRELDRTVDWGMDDMTTGYDVDFSQRTQVPRAQLNVIFFTDRERCMRLHRLLLEIQDLHSLLNLEGLASRAKLNSWKGCVKAFESVLLWLMGKRYSFVEKQQQSLKALENQSLSPPLGPTTISYLVLSFASHVHRAQTAELQTRLNEFPGIKSLSSEFWEGKLSSNSWLTTRHSTSIRLAPLHSDLQLAFN